MSKARDIANILSANTAIATDAEVTAAISAATSGLATTSAVSTAVTNERTATATLTNKTIDGNSNTINIKRGPTANRPGTSTSGDQYFDTDEQKLYQYTSTGWQRVSLDAPPQLTSISPTVSAVAGTVINLTGTNFRSGAIVKFIGTNGIEYQASTTTFISSTQVSASTPSLSVSYEPYDVKIINSDNQYSQIDNVLDAGGTPTWNTASGNIGNVFESLSASFSVSATDPDGTSIIYTSSDIPNWLSLNSSTGALTGTAPAVSSDTTYSFNITASDGTNTSSRSFNVIVKDLTLATSGLIMHLDASNTSSYSGSGSTWYDLSGNSKNVSLFNSSFVSTDGGGISFNGTSTYGTFNSSGFTTSYTIEAVVYLNTYNSDGSTSSDIMMLTNSSGSHGLLLEVDAGPRWRNVHRFPYGTSPDDELLTSNGSVTNNTKYHVMVVRDGSTSQKLYINGVEVATKTPVNSGFDTNLTAGTLGRLNQVTSSRYWSGYMHQIRIYNRALSVSEVAGNFNYIKGKFGL